MSWEPPSEKLRSAIDGFLAKVKRGDDEYGTTCVAVDTITHKPPTHESSIATTLVAIRGDILETFVNDLMKIAEDL